MERSLMSALKKSYFGCVSVLSVLALGGLIAMLYFQSNRSPEPIQLDRFRLDSLMKPNPFVSPREGSDIMRNQSGLLQCSPPSSCIVPQLELAEKMKVYLCGNTAKGGVRHYYTIREGLWLHPNVELVTIEHINEADFIIHNLIGDSWEHTECADPAFRSRLILLDPSDSVDLVSPRISEETEQNYGGHPEKWYFMYFKRSFVKRKSGEFLGYPHLSRADVYPLSYSIADVYIPANFNLQERDTEIMCTLRSGEVRERISSWVSQYGVSRAIKRIIAGQVNEDSRTTVSLDYFQQMHNSRIIVTVNPTNWEGDFRLWESLSTGALVFVDYLYVPHPHPLVGGEHVVFFDNSNKTDLYAKLDYYRANVQEAHRIAVNGYLFAMKHHRTVNVIDYILRTAHLKRAMKQKTPLPQYTYTGQYLNYEATAQEKAVLACRAPGIYDSVKSNYYMDLVTPPQTATPRLTCADYQRDISKKRNIPHFIIIGAQKCGTTSMYAYICQHPQVVEPKQKELHHFTKNFGEDYMRWFPTELMQVHESLVTGEATPSYMLHSGSVIPRIKAITPWVKLIVLLRNPTDRAFSHYNMIRDITHDTRKSHLQHTKHSGYSHQSFLKAIRQDIDLLHSYGVSPNMRPEAFAKMVDKVFPPVFDQRSIVVRGLYALQLEQWLKEFPKDQITIYSILDLQGENVDVRRTLNEVFGFLDLPPYDGVDLSTKNTREYESMPEDCRALLDEFYAPYNARLFKLLGKQLEW